MDAQVKKWGNSAAVRIPAAVLAETGIELDQPVVVRSEGGRIVIEPVQRKVFAIGELVRAIRAEDLHDPIETGSPVGREVW
jgi:antitoxin MazE